MYICLIGSPGACLYSQCECSRQGEWLMYVFYDVVFNVLENPAQILKQLALIGSPAMAAVFHCGMTVSGSLWRETKRCSRL